MPTLGWIGKKAVIKGKNLKHGGHEGKRRNFDRIYTIDKILYYFFDTD